MSENPKHADPKHGAATIRASRGGGGKLLLGAVAVAILAGGGYFAWKTYGTPSNSAQSAYNDSYASSTYDNDPLRGATREADDDTLADTASADTTAPAPAEPRAMQRSTTAREPVVAEETIGITPISATSEASDGEDIVVTAAPRPIWVRTPSARRLSALYPERALERGREGEARLHCTVQGDGGLDCARMEETPGGFGPAALRVARTLRHAPQLGDGRDATGTPVNLRVVFRMDENERRG